jgi:hypothetical protein
LSRGRRWLLRALAAGAGVVVVALLGLEGAYQIAARAWADSSLLSSSGVKSPAVHAAASAATGRPLVSNDPLFGWTVVARWLSPELKPSLPQVVAYRVASCRPTGLAPKTPTAWDRLVLTMWLSRHQDLGQLLATLFKICRVQGADETLLELAQRVGAPVDPESWTADQAAVVMSLALSSEPIDPACRPSLLHEKYLATRTAMCSTGVVGCGEAPWTYDFGPCKGRP